MRYREPRYPCDTDLAARHDGATQRVVNVGQAGARVDGLGLVPRGSAVTLTHLGASYAATVIWSTPQRTGLRFWQRLTPAQVAALRQVGSHDNDGWMQPGLRAFREMA